MPSSSFAVCAVLSGWKLLQRILGSDCWWRCALWNWCCVASSKLLPDRKTPHLLWFICYLLSLNPTVILMTSFHTRRSLFLITGSHHNPHNFRDYYSLVHQLPMKIFLLNSQKRRQMTQSNIPPLFTRRRSAGYWAILTNTNHYIQEIRVVWCQPVHYALSNEN